MRRIYTLLLIFPFAAIPAFAQENEQQDQVFTIDTPVNLDFEKEEEPINTKKKKKKPKKKVFYGIKTRKGFTKKGYGDKITYEIFYVLKKPERPQTFVRDIWWYDYTRREIRKTSNFDPEKGVLLHGPYVKKQGDVLLEKGIFFKGTKHGRWMAYKRDSVLTDKEKYYKGWPRESLVSYYDPNERRKMKEITPIEYGEKEGYYYMFFQNGKKAVEGEYKWDNKVGDWTEYYQDGKRKRIVAYSKEPFNAEAKAFIRIEWDAKGKEIYRNNRKSD
jgi:antitoxin component YwqK of YwqJK toxin-antitoxin module